MLENIINEKVTLKCIIIGLLLELVPAFICNHGEEDSNNYVNFQPVNTESFRVGRFALILIHYQAYLLSACLGHFP